jgi:hypothetical protein
MITAHTTHRTNTIAVMSEIYVVVSINHGGRDLFFSLS